MPNTNFRKKFFNDEIKHIIKSIYQGCSRYQPIDQLLNHLHHQLIAYYTKQRLDYNKKSGRIRAEHVFSEFKQHLIYYVAHNLNKDPSQTLRIILTIIGTPGSTANRSLFYVHNDQVTFWSDPITQWTALHVVAITGDREAVNYILQAAEYACGNISSSPLQQYLTQTTIQKNNTLHHACQKREKHVVVDLIAAFKLIHGNNKQQLRQFLFNPNNKQFTCLITASNKGYYDVVQILIDTAIDTSSDEMGLQWLQDFFSHTNNHGLNALTATIQRRHTKIAVFLIESAVKIYDSNKTALLQFLSQPTTEGFTPLISASFCGDIGIVELLIFTVMDAYGDTQECLTQLQKFLLVESNKINALIIASQEGYDEIVATLLEYAETAFGGKSTPGFKTFINHQDDSGFTALNSACHHKKSKETVALLIKYGANPKIPNNQGFRVIDNILYTWQHLLKEAPTDYKTTKPERPIPTHARSSASVSHPSDPHTPRPSDESEDSKHRPPPWQQQHPAPERVTRKRKNLPASSFPSPTDSKQARCETWGDTGRASNIYQHSSYSGCRGHFFVLPTSDYFASDYGEAYPDMNSDNIEDAKNALKETKSGYNSGS